MNDFFFYPQVSGETQRSFWLAHFGITLSKFSVFPHNTFFFSFRCSEGPWYGYVVQKRQQWTGQQHSGRSAAPVQEAAHNLSQRRIRRPWSGLTSPRQPCHQLEPWRQGHWSPGLQNGSHHLQVGVATGVCLSATPYVSHNLKLLSNTTSRWQKAACYLIKSGAVFH